MPSQITLTLHHKEPKNRVFLKDTVHTLEEMNAYEREMSANVPRGHEMAL